MVDGSLEGLDVTNILGGDFNVDPQFYLTVLTCGSASSLLLGPEHVQRFNPITDDRKSTRDGS